MKNQAKVVLFTLLTAMVVVAVVYMAMNKTPDKDLSADAQVLTILDDGGCINCHSSHPNLPFYASFPIAGDLVKADSESGYRAYDVDPAMKQLAEGGTVGEVDLAKIEKVIADGRMPMAKYYLVHWGSSITKAKKEIVLDWAKNYRGGFYADGLDGSEPIRPIDESVTFDSKKAELGKLLFTDTRLSVDNTISCADCHELTTGGVDNEQVSDGVNDAKGGVNAPTVYNAVYNFVQFWDGRANTLAEQAAGPPLNPVEMANESFDQIIAKLNADKAFKEMFAAVYPEGFTEQSITGAIEEYERTLLTPNSRFDKYLKGDKTAINEDELKGYELFKKYSCATCHAGKNLGGLSYELMGLRHDYFADRNIELTNEDNGRFKETNEERDRHRFKVPGLRNVDLTWPYFHDGTRKTLEEAVIDMAYYESDRKLTDGETAKITAFLKTLTGEFEGKTLTNANERD